MKKNLLSGALAAIAVLLAAGCGGRAATVHRNAAGTRSVSLSAAGTVPAAGEAASPGKAIEANEKAAVTPDDGTYLNSESAAGTVPAAGESASPENVIEIKEKMFIAQTNDVYLNPDEYLGKTIKLEGLFKTSQYYEMEAPYCFVIRYGPGCCGYDGTAGFEIAWEAEKAVPYPAEDEWVEAIGTLSTYIEDDYPYLYLSLSQLNILNTRGAEFVSQ
jgi:uncharacterized membrane protein YcgQ (UPF0703/DUF1980 family)